MAALRDRLEAGLKAAAPDVVIFGAGAERLPNTTLFAVPGMKAETAVIAFDLDGVAVSSGAACSSGKVRPPTCWPPWGSPGAGARRVRVSLGPSHDEATSILASRLGESVPGALLKGRNGRASAA